MYENEDQLCSLADGIAMQFKAVAFDMDQCMVAVHSHGRLRRDALGSFIAQVSPDFKNLVPLLAARGIKLAVATHSDEAEYRVGLSPSTYIMGEELVREVLRAAVPSFADSFEIVAFNPYIRHGAFLLFQPDKLAKKYHIRELRRKFSMMPSEPVLLFDDDNFNVWLTEDACTAVKVNPARGFRVADLPRHLFLPPPTPP